jgi:hypothetical protein
VLQIVKRLDQLGLVVVLDAVDGRDRIVRATDETLTAEGMFIDVPRRPSRERAGGVASAASGVLIGGGWATVTAAAI